ncbi:hypothetical protein ARAM_002273 [Aspergillus rambellii]|uniref:Uncharacterized protein n=3 Tax=Aspergillus subgen. Nidulantes TaxID=2720870 RepID=A0A0F8TZ99_9EURO|nr:hypothetical protein ARAM_002273 [Aspergillus rambellii]KKK23787.1 hypothetical protein AOCH_000294 [Aspergillus ochraceoroseus]
MSVDKTPRSARSSQEPAGLARDKPSAGKYGTLQDEFQLKEDIKDYDWNELQSQYMIMMEKHGKGEEELRDHIATLLQIFTAWSQTTVVHDETRALKRFRTQMHHVQNSEESLEKKRNHYIDVVKAFESALALLNDRVKI